MKKTILILTLLLSTLLTSQAQDLKIGYFSYNAVLRSMPAYSTAVASVDKLRQQYAAELEAAQKEFNEKYELFLDQQNKLAESIRQKRQADLQTLLDRNEQFKKEAERLLAQAEKDAMAPIQQRVNNAVRLIAAEQGYDIILNTDSNAVPFISSVISEDINALVQTALTK